MDSRPIDILVVDDHPADRRLTEEIFASCETSNTVNTAADGEEALRYLRREGEHSEASRPDLILLDLDLPGVGGNEVLSEIKDDPALSRIPVIALSTSVADRDVLAAYANRANACVRKPANLQEFTAMIEAVEAFWLGNVALPGRRRI